MAAQLLVGLLYLLSGLLIVVVSFFLLARRIGPNRWLGFIIPKAYQSDEYWYRINRYGAHQMIRWAAAIAGLGAYLLIAGTVEEPTLRWITFGAPLLLLIPIVLTILYARRLP